MGEEGDVMMQDNKTGAQTAFCPECGELRSPAYITNATFVSRGREYTWRVCILCGSTIDPGNPGIGKQGAEGIGISAA